MSLTARLLTFAGLVAILISVGVGTFYLFVQIGDFIPVFVQSLMTR